MNNRVIEPAASVFATEISSALEQLQLDATWADIERSCTRIVLVTG